MARSVRHVGFPEVFLGIIPGWGGTQLTPRLVGAAAAVELIVANPLAQNRFIGAARAAELGLVDELLDDVEFLDDSIEWLVRAIETPPPERDDGRPVGCEGGLRKARFAVDDAVHGVALAPYRALDLIAGTADWTIADGYASGGGRARGSPAGAAGAGGRVRIRPRRTPNQEGDRHPGRDAASHRARRRRRRRPDGDAACDALPAPARGTGRAHRHRRRPCRRRGRRDPSRSGEAGRARSPRRGQGALPRLARQRGDRDRRLRRLRPRDRGGVRGAGREAGGVRLARGASSRTSASS